MQKGKYYKVPREWAVRAQVTEFAPRHPDGWHLLIPMYAVQVMNIIQTEHPEKRWTLDEAILFIGGKIYDASQALASQRGEAGYRCDVADTQPSEEGADLQQPEDENI